MKKYDLLIAGECNPDLILTSSGLTPRFNQVEVLVDDMAFTIGASSAIVACGAARLGLKVAFVTVVGNDTFGRYMLEELEQRGVDISHCIVDSSQRTGLTVILNQITDRAMLTYAGTISSVRPEHISDTLLQSTRHIHISSFFLQPYLRPALPALFSTAHQYGASTSLDTNWDPEERWSGVEKTLAETDLFFPNENEARLLTKTDDIESAIEKLARISRVTAVKMGKDGGAARTGTTTFHVPAIPVEVADTVGAGDTFDAGFLYGFLQGWPVEQCLRMAVVCGSLSTRAHGGTEAQPTLAEATSTIELHYN